MNFQEAIAHAQWTAEEQVAVLLTYIERQGSEEAFHDYLEEASEDTGVQASRWIDIINIDIHNAGELDIARAKRSAEGEDETAYFYEMAQAIVEPSEIGEAYFDFMERDKDVWVAFIRGNISAEWAELAELVNEFGY